MSDVQVADLSSFVNVEFEEEDNNNNDVPVVTQGRTTKMCLLRLRTYTARFHVAAELVQFWTRDYI